MTTTNLEAATLHAEIAELRREVARLSDVRAQLATEVPTLGDSTANIYVFDDDDEEARAFDEFYRAYDEVHAKTRKFLLG